MKQNSFLSQTHCVLREIESLLGKTAQTRAWNDSLDSIESRLQESVLRLAVVGTVKSGKSSFVNALLARDILKRGAGILTSSITRIRSGSIPRASIHFKSWKCIISELEAAFSFLAHSTHSDPPEFPDFRTCAGRETLHSFLENHPQHFSQAGDSFQQEYSLICAYLQGYESLHSYLLEDEQGFLVLNEESLLQHQNFVAQDSHAIYMKDIVLELPFPSQALQTQAVQNSQVSSLEIADCQGCDSPNPLHFARVQEYVLQSSLIIYVISSRTGIRQGDLILLRSLQQLNMLSQTLFVFNQDLEEHESLQESQKQLQHTRNLLQEWIPDPQIHSFSVLFQLLSAKEQKQECSAMEQMRLLLWRETSPLLHNHEKEWNALGESFRQHLKHTEHHALQQAEFLHWKHLLSQMKNGLHQISALILEKQQHQEQLQQKGSLGHQQLAQILNSLESTVEGSKNHWKERVKSDVNTLFEATSGSWVSRLKHFVQHYQPSSLLPQKNKLHSQVLTLESEQWGISYLIEVYQDLRHQLLAFLTQEINASLLHALKELRSNYLKEIQEMCAPFVHALQTASQERGAMNQSLEAPVSEQLSPANTMLETLQFPEASLIPFSLSLQYHTPQKLQSFYVLGKGVLQHQFRGWGKQKDASKKRKSESLQNFLEEALLKKLRQEALETLEFDLLNYQENLKYRYLFQGIQDLMQSIQTRLRLQGESAILDHQALQEHLQNSNKKQELVFAQIASLTQQLQNLEKLE